MAKSTIIVAIGRQVGSGGAELGQRLAQRLGFAYLDRQIVQEAARHLGVTEEVLRSRDERVMGFWERLVGMLSIGVPESVYADFRRVPEITDESLFGVESEVIRDLVQERDSVLIGHAGFHCLCNAPGLVSVYLHADRKFRIQRMADWYSVTDPAAAAAMIDRTDREREQFIGRMTGLPWTDARNYDLCINMSEVPMEITEEIIIGLIERKRKVLESARDAGQ